MEKSSRGEAEYGRREGTCAESQRCGGKGRFGEQKITGASKEYVGSKGSERR